MANSEQILYGDLRRQPSLTVHVLDDGVEEHYFNGQLVEVRIPEGASWTWRNKNGQLHHIGRAAGSKIAYLLDGQLHRDDGPALKRDDGHCEYWKHGKKHRDDGPAVITAIGGRKWYVHGKMHREDGPAWVGVDGRCQWWLEHKVYSNEAEWRQALKSAKRPQPDTIS